MSHFLGCSYWCDIGLIGAGNVRLYWRRLALVIILSVAVAQSAMCEQGSRTVSLVLPRDAAAPVKHGAAALSEAFTKKGLQVKIASESVAWDLEVVVRVSNGKPSGRVPEKPESYAISFSSNHHSIYVNGSDDTGLMYGEFELAEQIANSATNNWERELKPADKSPFLEIRGVNMFLTVQDVDNPDGAFWSDDYWEKYLDTMAHDRYNFLDIHGLCDAVTLTFPNGFSYFLSLPDFREVGVGPERAARNIARFRQVIQMAADRGIKVGYMNYEAPPPIGPWQTRRVGVDERWTQIPQEFLEGPRLVEYTREAVSSFLKQLQGLWMVGFRVGGSGQREDF